MRPGDSSSSRMAKTRMIENATLEKRFEVAVHPACARRFGFPSTKRSPSLSSYHRLVFLPSTVTTSGRGSSLRIPRMKSPEAEEADGVDEDRRTGR